MVKEKVPFIWQLITLYHVLCIPLMVFSLVFPQLYFIFSLRWYIWQFENLSIQNTPWKWLYRLFSQTRRMAPGRAISEVINISILFQKILVSYNGRQRALRTWQKYVEKFLNVKTEIPQYGCYIDVLYTKISGILATFPFWKETLALKIVYHQTSSFSIYKDFD